MESRLQGSAGASRTTRSAAARIGESLEVFVVMPGLLNGRSVTFSEDGGSGRVSWLRSGCAPLEVSWLRVEPRMIHTETPSPNASTRVYANAVLFGHQHGKWIGYDRLEYFETPLPELHGLSTVVHDARPSELAAPRPLGHEGLGTLRLAARVRVGPQELRTPGAEDAPRGQISDRVFRYSFRSGDGFIGWLTSYYNVPYLFGSAGDGAQNQADRYIGADCADVLVAALRHAGQPRLRYTNVGGVIDEVGKTGAQAIIKVCPGSPASCPNLADPPLRFGTDVKPGDILALDYLGAGDLPRALDHIVVLVEDSGPNGKPDGMLGPQDLVVDSGDEHGLKFAPLGDQGNIRVVVARPRGVIP